MIHHPACPRAHDRPTPAPSRLARCVVLTLHGCIAFGLGLPAHAQTTPAAEDAKPAPQAEPVQATTLDSVTVTASKRSQSIQDLNFSISAISQEELQNSGARNFTDLISAVPSLSAFQTGNGRSQLIMRGVATGASSEDDPQTQETVGLYIDESPVSVNGFNPEAGMFDLERVEVLRGPQGTLYGAGAMSGAIRMVTRKPELDTFGGDVEMGVGSINHGGTSHSLKAVVNLPVADGVAALRAAAYTDHFGGFIKNLGTGEKNINRSTVNGGRVALRVVPNDRLTIDLSGWLQKNSDHGRGLDEGGYARTYLSPEGSNQEFNLSNLTVTGDFDWGSVVSSTSYFDMDILNRWALDKTLELFAPELHYALADTTRINALTQEVRAVSDNDGPLKWLVGAYYNRRTRGYTNSWPVPGWDQTTGYVSADFGAPDDHPFWGIQNVHTQETALFGEATYSWDKVDLTLGLRAFDWSMRHWQYQSGFFNGGATSNGMQRTSESGVNPKFNAGYRVNEDHLVYFQAARGFRYGGINQVIPINLCGEELEQNGLSPSESYDSDKLWNYEVGNKSAFFDNRLTVNSALYVIKWSDVQVRRGLNCGVNYRENGAGLTSKGAELEVAYRPAAGLVVKAGAAYTHATLDQDVPQLSAQQGDFAPYVPKFTFNTSAAYDFPIKEGLDGFVWGSWQYTGRRQSDFNPALSTFRRIDAYNTLNLRAGLRWEKVELSAYVNNVGDSDGVVRQVASTPFYPDGSYRITPRTVGMTMRVAF